VKVSIEGIGVTKSNVRFDAEHPMFEYQVESVPADITKWMQSYEHFVVVGMGGSVLPLKVFVKAFELEDKVLFLDRLDQSWFEKLLLMPNTLFCVVSKSGETIEIQALLQELLRANRKQDLLAVTDPQAGALRSLVSKLALPSLPIPSKIGGRFTHFTVFHRALMERFGISFEKILQSACLERDQLKADSTVLQQMFQAMFNPHKSKMVLWGYGERFRGFADWLQQAVAESLGKKKPSGERVGVFPIVLQGPQDQHSVLQLLMDGPQDFSIWFFEEQSQPQKTLDALRSLFCESVYESFRERIESPETSLPLVHLKSDLSESDLGRLIARFQALIEYCGKLLEINAFDQPGVERGKQIARQKLQK
jgi:glucose-6-phosphate isomerase